MLPCVDSTGKLKPISHISANTASINPLALSGHVEKTRT